MRHRRAQGILWMAMAALGLTGVGQAQQGHFENPHPVPGLDSRYRDWSPFPSADGLTMYFGSDRQLDGAGRANFEPDAFDLWRATREKRADDEGTEVPFGEPEFLAPPVNTVFSEGGNMRNLGLAGGWPSISTDGLTLCFCRFGQAGVDSWVATRAAAGAMFGVARRLNIGRGVSICHLAPSFDWPGADSKVYGTFSPAIPNPFDANDWDIYQLDWVLEPPPVLFRRGDSNADGTVNIADGVSTLSFLFLGGDLYCADAADTDDSGQLDILDSIRTFNFLFVGGAAPAPPGPDACGEDPIADKLSCGAGCP